MKTKQRSQASKFAAIAEEKRDILVKKATDAAKEIKHKIESKVEDIEGKLKEGIKESEEKLEKIAKKTGVKSAVDKFSGKVAQMVKEK